MKGNGSLARLNMDCNPVRIKSSEIYDVYLNEFKVTHGPFPSVDIFNTCIEPKIGVRAVSYLHDLYIIVDNKKWLFAKIKYGI